jgi:hypothetical protein
MGPGSETGRKQPPTVGIFSSLTLKQQKEKSKSIVNMKNEKGQTIYEETKEKNLMKMQGLRYPELKKVFG